MKGTKPQISWIIYPNIKEHNAPEGFDNIIPPIGTRICIGEHFYFVHQHVMYYDESKKPIYSIRAREARPFESFYEK